MMKITKTIIWGLLAAAWLSGANAWAQANPHEQGAMSVRKLDDGLYYMEYPAAPKIFFRYYYVNSSTGEKSGTMLAECKWAPAAAGGEP